MANNCNWCIWTSCENGSVCGMDLTQQEKKDMEIMTRYGMSESEFRSLVVEKRIRERRQKDLLEENRKSRCGSCGGEGKVDIGSTARAPVMAKCRKCNGSGKRDS